MGEAVKSEERTRVTQTTCLAMHVRTGDPGSAGFVDGWLRAHDARIVDCADAYDACVRLIQQAEHVPDLVFIGADWLDADEQQILRYVRDTWPAVGVIVYGQPPQAFTDRIDRLHLCASRGDLERLLDRAPPEVAEKLDADAGRTPPPRAGGARGAEPAQASLASQAPAAEVGAPREEHPALLDEDDR